MTQAEIIGYNSAGAMEFKDVPAATATLSALTAKEGVVAAGLYGRDDKIFAQYSRNNRVIPSRLSRRSGDRAIDLRGIYLQVFHEVTLNGERLGTLLLQSDMRQLECKGQALCRYSLHFRIDLGLIRVLGLFETQRLDLPPYSAPGDTMRMVRPTAITRYARPSLRRRNWTADRWL